MLDAVHRDEHTLSPGRLAAVMSMVRAEKLHGALENARHERIEVLGEHHAMRGTLDSQLVSELRKVLCTSQVDDRIRHQPVPVASADDGQSEALRERQYLSVLAPGSVSVQLEGVNPIAMGAQQREKR